MELFSDFRVETPRRQFPKIRCPNMDPKAQVILLFGHLQSRPPACTNSHKRAGLFKGADDGVVAHKVGRHAALVHPEGVSAGLDPKSMQNKGLLALVEGLGPFVCPLLGSNLPGYELSLHKWMSTQVNTIQPTCTLHANVMCMEQCPPYHNFRPCHNPKMVLGRSHGSPQGGLRGRHLVLKVGGI